MCLIITGVFGEWREDGPMSLPAHICFWPHIPGLFVGDFLGLLYPSSASLLLAVLVATFLASLIWSIALFGFFTLRGLGRAD
jgi:hypothetical protein